MRLDEVVRVAEVVQGRRLAALIKANDGEHKNSAAREHSESNLKGDGGFYIFCRPPPRTTGSCVMAPSPETDPVG